MTRHGEHVPFREGNFETCCFIQFVRFWMIRLENFVGRMYMSEFNWLEILPEVDIFSPDNVKCNIYWKLAK